MTDDVPPDAPAGEQGDERDRRVASQLEVPPLDEVTRRQLVTRALDASGGQRRVRRVLVPTAAALVVLVFAVAGVLALANRDGNGSGTTDRSAAPTAQPSAENGVPADEVPPPEALADLRDLGDLGDLSDAGDVRRQVTEARARPGEAARGTAPACLDRALTGSPAPSAFGTGTHRGRPVLALLLPGGDDRTTVVLLDAQTCRAVRVLQLP